jgi:hypothetical protein
MGSAAAVEAGPNQGLLEPRVRVHLLEYVCIKDPSDLSTHGFTSSTCKFLNFPMLSSVYGGCSSMNPELLMLRCLQCAGVRSMVYRSRIIMHTGLHLYGLCRSVSHRCYSVESTVCCALISGVNASS